MTPTMRTYFDVRGPGVLVDPSTPEGRPMRVDVTPAEENRPPITVMNTGEATDDFAFDYRGLAAGWTSVVDRRTLGDDEEVQASPAIVPAADAATGVHRVTIAGESESDGSVRSQAVFEVNVVLDRTEISRRAGQRQRAVRRRSSRSDWGAAREAPAVRRT